jgi:malonate-semialdehyde dehydrogenase (acetylating)/methylmalonate-semialdehyde dehydrogenase
MNLYILEELAEIVVKENGKNKMEALASVMKGNETVEYACSLPQLIQGKILQVSRGITCQEIREPLGIVACVVPFNFPIMVPMWTVPIALTLGNCVILKPSEKVPMTMRRMAELMVQAGIPNGVFQIINGKEEAVTSLCDHPDISALSFVGSSKIAQLVSRRCRALDKRVLALGGAKNHLVALPDADHEMASKDIVASFAGCAGQRCMAASVLLMVGKCNELLQKIIEKTKKLTRGTQAGQVGAIIDQFSKARILQYINEAEEKGAKILVDGRSWAKETKGFWIGPTILLHTNCQDPAMKEEIFGPVLSIYQVETFEEAIEIENNNPYGNAACVYTSNGGFAEFFQTRFRAAMIGVNIGIPVPREPFSFGGLYGTRSKYGDMDITGDGCIEFFSNRRKITSKWSNTITNLADKANFSSQM